MDSVDILSFCELLQLSVTVGMDCLFGFWRSFGFVRLLQLFVTVGMDLLFVLGYLCFNEMDGTGTPDFVVVSFFYLVVCTQHPACTTNRRARKLFSTVNSFFLRVWFRRVPDVRI